MKLPFVPGADAALPAPAAPPLVPGRAVEEAMKTPVAPKAVAAPGARAAAVKAQSPVRASVETAVARLNRPGASRGAEGEAGDIAQLYGDGERSREDGAPTPVLVEPATGRPSPRLRRAAAAAKTVLAQAAAVAPWLAASDIPARAGVEPMVWLAASAAAVGAWAGSSLFRGWERALRPNAAPLSGAGAVAGAVAAVGLGVAAVTFGFWSVSAGAAVASAAALGMAAHSRLLGSPGLFFGGRSLAGFSHGSRGTLMAVPPATLGRLMTLSGTLERGLGEKDLYTRRADGFDRLVYLRRAGDFIELVARNTKFRAAPGAPLERAVREAIPDSVLAKARVRREDPWTGAAAIDADELFGGDLFDLAPALGYSYEGVYELDEESSGVTGAKGYPSNAELRSRLVFVRTEAGEDQPATHLADARRLELVMRYSLHALPEGDFAPRPADERIGVFETEHQDLTDPTKPDIDLNFAHRWKLEKRDPTAAASPVKEPIVYWLDPSVPDLYRPAARRAVEEWNKAFARVGLLGAIELRDAPSDGSFDPSDARYNVISFYLERDSGFAIGPSRVNPLTGQIFNASVAVSLYHVRHALGLSFADLDETDLEDLDRGGKDRRGHRHHAGCRHAEGAGREAAMTLDVMAARGAVSEEEKRRFVSDYITDLLLHEIGHTLGLRHNFLAKAWRANEELSDASPIAASVMDYIPVNLAAPGEKQGSFWNTEIGPYDYLAIEYLYKPMPGLSADQRGEELKKIAGRMDELGLLYATDEDLVGIDPTSRTWVLGKDVLGFAAGRMRLVRELWDALEARRAAGDDGRALYRAWVNGWKAYYRAARAASSFVGGLLFRRRAASGGASYVPVPAEEQRRALALLDQLVFADAPLAVPPALAAAMAPSRMSTVNQPYPELSYVPYDDLTLSLRTGALDYLLDEETLERLSESARLAGKEGAPLPVEELFHRLAVSVWLEALNPPKTKGKAKRTISEPRRRLQEAHLHRLMALAFPADGEEIPHLTFAARAHLRGLQASLKSAGSKPGWDAATRAHFKQSVQHLIRAFKDYLP